MSPSTGRRFRWAAAAVAGLALAGCATQPAAPGAPAKADGGAAPTGIKLLGCAVGGIGGAFLAKALAESEGRRLRLTPEQLRQRERSYLVGLALAGCGGGSVLANSVYGKLSERGKRAREAELMEAARSATVRTYTDPDNPALVGRIAPQPSFTQGNQVCRVLEDTLADAGRGEPVLVKYCHTPPSGQWSPQAV